MFVEQPRALVGDPDDLLVALRKLACVLGARRMRRRRAVLVPQVLQQQIVLANLRVRRGTRDFAQTPVEFARALAERAPAACHQDFASELRMKLRHALAEHREPRRGVDQRGRDLSSRFGGKRRRRGDDQRGGESEKLSMTPLPVHCRSWLSNCMPIAGSPTILPRGSPRAIDSRKRHSRGERAWARTVKPSRRTRTRSEPAFRSGVPSRSGWFASQIARIGCADATSRAAGCKRKRTLPRSSSERALSARTSSRFASAA